MFIAFICIQVLSLIWFLYLLARNGYFSIQIHRKTKFLFKTKNKESQDSSSMIIRILERYKNGEFNVQKSKFNDNLLFTKTFQNGSTKYDSQRMYVQVGDPLDKCFGWVSDEARHVVHYRQNHGMICDGHGPITYEAWEMLMELRTLLYEDDETPANHNFFKHKHKNEEVHLS